ncbi:MAG: hypothetical protein WBF43_08885 [Methylocella sp.]
MKVIQFPPAKGPPGFDGMGRKIDGEEQRANWGAAFTSVQTAPRFCNFNTGEAEGALRKLLDEDDGWLIDTMRSDWTEGVECLERSSQR